MDVSIIIINYRTPDLIINCLQSIFQFTTGVSLEVIIVDNDPGNGEQERIKGKYEAVKWVNMPYNAGFGRANNAGMETALGRYLLLLNADTLVTDNVIGRCVERMDRNLDVAACGALQRYPDGTPMPFYKSFNDFRKSFFIVPPGGFFQKVLDTLLPEPKYDDPEQFDWLVGAFMMVRREAYAKVGGFEESLFMYGEDVEWSGRLGAVGKLCYFADCSFVHLENENPYRRTKISWINRFSTQMQVSNLVWVRKRYGVGMYVLILAHYLCMIPVIYGWRMAINFRESGNPFTTFHAQNIFTRKVKVLFSYFWKTINFSHHFFQIKPEENIDKLSHNE